MKLISWNVNGIRAVERKGDLQAFIKKFSPDIFFLQEIKGNQEQFSQALTNPKDYITFYHSAEKKGYSGTGIWVKKNIIKSDMEYEFFSGMPAQDPKWIDNEGRVTGVKIKKNGKTYMLMGIYFPNGGKSEKAFIDKLVFYQDFLNYINELREDGEVCIWTGDLNCAHNEIDLARPKDNYGKIGFHPKERAWLDQVVADGWLDIWRKTHPDTLDVYSWWHYLTGSREKNVGWRIDYFFCFEDYISSINSVSYLNQQLGSDHCPIMLDVDLD